MIVVDTSALIAILAREPEHQPFLKLLDAVDRRLVSAVTLYETGIVLRTRLGPAGLDAQAEAALAAYLRYGKGIDPRARLNMGDCAAYALAKGLNAPLLFKGTDFAATDVISAA
jgi:ribonuclease VapC